MALPRFQEWRLCPANITIKTQEFPDVDLTTGAIDFVHKIESIVEKTYGPHEYIAGNNGGFVGRDSMICKFCKDKNN